GRFSSPLTSIRYRDRRSGLKVSLAIWVTVRSSMSFPLLQRRVRVATGGQVLALVGQGLKGAGEQAAGVVGINDLVDKTSLVGDVGRAVLSEIVGFERCCLPGPILRVHAGQPLAEQDLHRALRAHDGDLCGWPRP